MYHRPHTYSLIFMSIEIDSVKCCFEKIIESNFELHPLFCPPSQPMNSDDDDMTGLTEETASFSARKSRVRTLDSDDENSGDEAVVSMTENIRPLCERRRGRKEKIMELVAQVKERNVSAPTRDFWALGFSG